MSYKINNKLILDNISFIIKDNEKVLLKGPSGAGKSTIANLLLRNIYLSKGNIYVDNADLDTFSNKENLNYKRNVISSIYQIDDLFNNLSVLENLTMFYSYQDVIKILKRLKLTYLMNNHVINLSIGERQRISIIKTLLSNCKIIIADEITSALDKDNAKEIIDFILSAFKDKTIIFISHDVDLFKDKVDHVITLENKKIKEEIINDIKFKNYKRKQILMKQRIDIRFSILSFLIFIINVINIYVSLNFNLIFNYFAKESFLKYIDYDILYIKDDDFSIIDDNIYYTFDDFFYDASIVINDVALNNYEVHPFINKDNKTKIVISSNIIEALNIQGSIDINISNRQTKYQYKNIDIYADNNMYSSFSLYYDFYYFNELGLNKDNKRIIINYDFDIIDERFTNNPIYEKKEKDLPYLESNAYFDYLTYKEIKEALDIIIKYYFIATLIYNLIVSCLIMISLFLKDSKKIAIYLSKGKNDLSIKLGYIIPFLLPSLLLLILEIKITKIYLSIIIALFTNLISLDFSYLYIKRDFVK